MPFKNQDITITLPEGAGPGQSRVVISTELPEPLASYSFSPGGEPPVGGLLFYTGNANDDYMFLVWAPITAGATEHGVIIGTVQSGVVREIDGQFAGVNFEGFEALWVMRLLGTVYSRALDMWRTSESSFVLQSHVGPTFGTLVGAATRFLMRASGEMTWKDSSGGEVVRFNPWTGTNPGMQVSSALGYAFRFLSDVVIANKDLTLTQNVSGDGGGILAEGMKSVSVSNDDDVIGFTNTSFDTVGGTIASLTFRAPLSGSGTIHFGARFECNNPPDNALISPRVLLGSSTVVSPSDSESLETENRLNASKHRHISGLTPGSLYTIRLEHRVFAGSGDIFHRTIKWVPDLAI